MLQHHKSMMDMGNFERGLPKCFYCHPSLTKLDLGGDGGERMVSEPREEPQVWSKAAWEFPARLASS
jgi:hypothetical protein